MKRRGQDQDVSLVVRAMKDRGNQPGLIREWLELCQRWAIDDKSLDAAALRIWLQTAKPKPFYPANVLAKMWPGFKIALGMEQRLTPDPPALWLENALHFSGLPYLLNADATLYFRLPGSDYPTKFLIVEQIHVWRAKALTQEEFDEIWIGDAT